MDLDFLKTYIAHRGLHGGEIPENSPAAFLAAVEGGFAVETDVRLSKDGVPVIFHDDSLLRMTGLNLPVEGLNAKELSTLRLGGSGERIPLFPEFLELIGGKVPLLLEIKNMQGVDRRTYLAAVSKTLEGYKGLYAVQSFNPFYAKEFKRLRPEIPCGVLATATSRKEDFNGSPLWRLKAHFVKHMSFNRSVKPNFISYRFSDYPQPCTEKFRGVKLAWTVRSPEEEARAKEYAEGIIFEGYLPAV